MRSGCVTLAGLSPTLTRRVLFRLHILEYSESLTSASSCWDYSPHSQLVTSELPVLQSSWTIFNPIDSYEGSHFSACLFDYNHPLGCEVASHCGFDRSAMTDGAENPSTSLLPVYLLWRNVSFKCLPATLFFKTILKRSFRFTEKLKVNLPLVPCMWNPPLLVIPQRFLCHINASALTHHSPTKLRVWVHSCSHFS